MSYSDLLAPRVVPLVLRIPNYLSFQTIQWFFPESTIVLFRKGQLFFSESTIVPLQKAQFVFYPAGGYIWVSGPPGDLEVQLAGISGCIRERYLSFVSVVSICLLSLASVPDLLCMSLLCCVPCHIGSGGGEGGGGFCTKSLTTPL